MAELNPFINAKQIVDEVEGHVTTSQDKAIANANSLRDAATQAIDALSRAVTHLNLDGETPPAPPEFPGFAGVSITLPSLPADSFGTITPINRPDPALGAVSALPPIDIDRFAPATVSINIPEAPEERTFGQVPVAPDLLDPVIPDAPVLDRPILPAMVDIAIPTFDFPQLPTFDAAAPEFHGTSVSTVLQWAETPYETVILQDEMAKLRQMWDGELGLPPAVEAALWERAASREDLSAARDISAAFIEFAGRGFTLPPGALVNRIDAVRQDAQVRKIGLGREILLKVADTQIENLRFACTQAIASENVLISLWTQVAGRQFDAAKIQLDAQMALYNAQIALFNAAQQAYATEATVFRARLDGQLAHIQVFRAELDGEIAKGQINEQRVRIYSEQVKATLADIEVYKAKMQGAQLFSEVQKTKIDSFRAQVQGYAETLQADQVRYQAYESRIKGETAKAGLLESQARAYAAYVSGQAAKADVGINNQRAEIAALGLKLQAYTAGLEKDRAVIAAQQASITAAAEANRVNTARFTAEAGAQTAIAEVQIRATESAIRNNISLYDVEVRKYVADMEQLIRSASVQIEALKSIASAHSTLAAGAMAGISISSSVSASGGVSASGSTSDSTTRDLTVPISF